MSKTASKAQEMSLRSAPMRLRQIALVTMDLERAQQLITHVLGTESVYEEPRWHNGACRTVSVRLFLLTSIVRLSKSTHLFLVPLGGDFIELVAPTEAGTTAGKLLEKRGDGGYMVIMQTEDAKTRREYLKKQGLAEVIFTHDDGDVVCTQYHPKGIKGGMMPELDSHAAGPDNPTPLQTRFSPWHACGSEYSAYGPGMRRSEHLALLGCVLRLQPGDADYEGAARQWEELFGVARSRDLLAFTNAKLGFVPGRQGQPGGLVSITVGVYGKDKLHAINGRAKTAGVCAAGRIRMGGVDWNFTLTGHGEGKNRL